MYSCMHIKHNVRITLCRHRSIYVMSSTNSMQVDHNVQLRHRPFVVPEWLVLRTSQSWSCNMDMCNMTVNPSTFYFWILMDICSCPLANQVWLCVFFKTLEPLGPFPGCQIVSLEQIAKDKTLGTAEHWKCEACHCLLKRLCDFINARLSSRRGFCELKKKERKKEAALIISPTVDLLCFQGDLKKV